MSALTAWRFSGTEGADDAVLRLMQLETQQAIEMQDAAVIRWPRYATAPTAQEHVTGDGGMVSALVRKVSKGGIDAAMVDSVKGDLTPGTSALVLLSSDAAIGAVVTTFQGEDMELIRSDLSVQQQDQVRAAFRSPAGADREPPDGEGKR